MQVDRRIGAAPHVAALAQQVAALTGPCIGCAACRGLCGVLIEALSLPDAILNRDRTGWPSGQGGT